MTLRRNRLFGAGTLALALVLGSAPSSLAQSEDLDPTALGLDPETVIEAVGSIPLGSTANMLGSLGSADVPLGTGSSSGVGTPSPVDPDITETEILGTETVVDPEHGTYEYWTVTSAAMQRKLVVEVVPSRGTGKAPVLYMLDGVDAPEGNSGWRHQASIANRMADENVHVVTPTGAFAAYYTDWDKVDPVIGYNKWETFLTEELPGLVESRLDTNGQNGVGGISMGGQAAMHLAAARPDLYDGVMSFSGYYSTMDQLGYQTVRLTIETRGGDVENMWGPHGSTRWKENDTISQVEKLKNTAVYFSSGSAVPGMDDAIHYGDNTQDLLVGMVLEKGVLEGTKAFEAALKAKGVTHKVDYAETGLHNWKNFLKNFDAGWQYIKPALQG